MKQCVLQPDKTCNECGECDDRCILDPNKICDNCFLCLDGDKKPFAEIPVSGVYFEDDYSRERKIAYGPDLTDEDYVLDTDEAWKEGFHFHLKTLPAFHASRARRRRHGR